MKVDDLGSIFNEAGDLVRFNYIDKTFAMQKNRDR